jgi:hypothetical protein
MMERQRPVVLASVFDGLADPRSNACGTLPSSGAFVTLLIGSVATLIVTVACA